MSYSKEDLKKIRSALKKKTREEARISLGMALYFEWYERAQIIKELFGEIEPIDYNVYMDKLIKEQIKKLKKK